MTLKRITASFIAILICLCAGAKSDGGYMTEKDIHYRTDAAGYAAERCVLDFYHPKDIKDFPTVVWFHGGGLVGGGKHIPEELRESGLGVIAVNYRLLGKATVQECIDDAAAAVAWAFREVASRGGDPGKIFVAGHSAGGYLTDMIVLEKKWLDAYGVDADSIAGAFPFSAQVITHFNVRAQQGIDPLAPRLDETAPLYHIRKVPMPFLVLSGDRELELYGRYEEQAYFWRMMKLVGNGDNCILYEFDGHSHGDMCHPAHGVMKRFIKGICEGKTPLR